MLYSYLYLIPLTSSPKLFGRTTSIQNKKKDKVHPCTGTEALYWPYRPERK